MSVACLGPTRSRRDDWIPIDESRGLDHLRSGGRAREASAPARRLDALCRHAHRGARAASDTIARIISQPRAPDYQGHRSSSTPTPSSTLQHEPTLTRSCIPPSGRSPIAGDPQDAQSRDSGRPSTGVCALLYDPQDPNASRFRRAEAAIAARGTAVTPARHLRHAPQSIMKRLSLVAVGAVRPVDDLQRIRCRVEWEGGQILRPRAGSEAHRRRPDRNVLFGSTRLAQDGVICAGEWPA